MHSSLPQTRRRPSARRIARGALARPVSGSAGKRPLQTSSRLPTRYSENPALTITKSSFNISVDAPGKVADDYEIVIHRKPRDA